MDENELEDSISSYKVQLAKIAEMLPTADTMTKLELYDLEKDLKEIIAVTEESLLTLKKNKLTKMVSESEETSNSNECSQTPADDVINKANEEVNESNSSFVGMKCRVKYTQEWGSFQYHNAMILDYDENTELDDVYVRVLFLNPTHISMVPCKYFMDGKCTFADQGCKFSHGYLVNIDELQEFEEPNFNNLAVGSQCIAKYDDNGVWYKATVSDIHEDQVTISFDTYSESRTLDFHEILPLVTSNDSSSSSDSDSEIEQDDDGVVQLTYKSGAMSGPLGEWEEHTRGIGSKLMAKMGYIFGKGLGKESQGRVDPVEIRLLPPGKSLDAILELREKGLIKDPTKRKKRKNKNIPKPIDDGKGTTKAAFELINRLTHKGSSERATSSSTEHKVKYGINDTYKQLKKHISKQKSNDVRQKQTDCKNLNVHMFKNSEKISILKKKLTKQKEALARNPGDTTISRTIKKNMEITQHELNELTKVENSLQDKLNMKQQTKKLSIF